MTLILFPTVESGAAKIPIYQDSPFDLNRFPSDIVHLLYLAFDNLPQSVLHKLIQCSLEMHDRFAPILYRTLNVNKGNVKSVLAGSDQKSHISLRPSRCISKVGLFKYTQSLIINDLPSAEHLSQALDKSKPSPRIHSCFPNTESTLFTSIKILHLSAKAIMGLADIYNASSWGSSPYNIPSQPILRALRYNLNPREIVLDYPNCKISLHLHSCIEEVITYLTQGWNLEQLTWLNLQRSLLGPVPKSKKLIYQFNKCALLDRMTISIEDPGDAQKGIILELRGLKCMPNLSWNRIVEEVWNKKETLKEEDWAKADKWHDAKAIIGS
ncbi:uncharacterized protein I206_102129 [Kwoniella pini CBS 10737]|uniref:Uncharacterized protein n=1 Tax=Kwoniella pini CBS 10737 TaxID=1296096 RepID=A0A1B9HUQ7_9TREE|nr:uncharacterized protein I206_06778 [Kwoniella pini CBS 10737]OCF47004.1 hypothetical protein I206_06778 [Kwoniella pini CBS 10737]